MSRQDLADALDGELMKRLLPATAVHALHGWLAGAGARYATGPSAHAVKYVPAHWSGITPWPDQLLERSQVIGAVISRAQVAAVAQEAVERGEWREALVASYVWGQGRTGYGPHRLKEILAEPNVSHALAKAGTALQEQGAVAAYHALYGAIRGLGPAFFTKLLYFLDLAMGISADPRALILDQRVARIVRVHATRVGLEMGVTSAPDVAAWTWSDGGWTPHRYGVYLRWITAASEQLISSGIGWPASSPDLLELALFDGVWDPAA
ncbi:8-oxoguanine DNA glycosylase OGG fold protein [Streptomyces hydrogenans]|uniref:8-oxoguanine DNA glycosylase OGG fold protein n=2 Tax=Streptomyces TaxID=1883 RepID=UPI00382DF2AA